MWIIGGVVLGVVGGLLIGLGLLWVYRDITQQWARGRDEGEALIN